MEGRRG